MWLGGANDSGELCDMRLRYDENQEIGLTFSIARMMCKVQMLTKCDAI